MQLIIVLAIIVIIALFFVFNLQSVTLIFFGGVMTVKFPLAVWVLLFTLTGMISSLTLQFLYGFGRVSPQSRFRPSSPNPPQPFPSPRTPPRMERSPEVEQRPPVVSSNDSDDWDIEVPPAQPTAPRNIDYIERRQVAEPSQSWDENRDRRLETTEFPQPKEREYIERRQVAEPPQSWDENRDRRLETTGSVNTRIQEDLEELKEESISPRQNTSEPSHTRDGDYIKEHVGENTTFEVQRPPQSVSRTGSIYSYTYREAKIPRNDTEQKSEYKEENKPKSKNNPNQVYDADFRVITPPYRQEEGNNRDFQADDDEDWI